MIDVNLLELRPLRDSITHEVYDMYQDIPALEIGSKNPINGVSFEEFKIICNKYIEEETELNKELNTTTIRYILFYDNEPIGEVGIRTTLNDFWINKGSQIFYKIRFRERNKGFGNYILKLALEEAKKLGFESIRVNCNNNNIQSKKVILYNDGILDTSYKNITGISSSYIIKLKKEN